MATTEFNARHGLSVGQTPYIISDTAGNLFGISANITGNVATGNVSGTTGTFTNIGGTLTTAAQPNITSVGTLSSLTVTGNVSAGNLSGTSIVGTLTTAAQTNITSVGNLSSLYVTGNVGIGEATPARSLEIADTVAQARLSYTADSIYTDLQTDSAGNLSILPTSGWLKANNLSVTTTAWIGDTSAPGTTTRALYTFSSSTHTSGTEWHENILSRFAPATNSTGTKVGTYIRSESQPASPVTIGSLIGLQALAVTNNNVTGGSQYGAQYTTQTAQGSTLTNVVGFLSQSSLGSGGSGQGTITAHYNAQNNFSVIGNVIVTTAYGGHYQFATSNSAANVGTIYGTYISGSISSGNIGNFYGHYVSDISGTTGSKRAFWSEIPSGTNQYNLYLSGTADNYLAGKLGVGGVPSTGGKARFIDTTISSNNYALVELLPYLTGSGTGYQNQGIKLSFTIADGAVRNTGAASIGVQSLMQAFGNANIAGSFVYGHQSLIYAPQANVDTTSSTARGYVSDWQSTGNAYTSGTGFHAADIPVAVATNGYGFYGSVASRSGAYNLYMGGTALNYIRGNLGLGENNTTPDRPLEVLSNTDPQVRLTYTDGSVYTDFQTDSTGNLVITPTGGYVIANIVGNISGNVTAAGSPTYIQYNTGNLLDASANLTYDNANAEVYTTANLSVNGSTIGTAGGDTGGGLFIYDAYTDSSNYERFGMYFAGNVFYMSSGQAGTGAAQGVVLNSSGSLFLQSAGAGWRIDSSNKDILAGVDNTYDIGASGANRPRHVYIAGNLESGANIKATTSTGYKNVQLFYKNVLANTTTNTIEIQFTENIAYVVGGTVTVSFYNEATGPQTAQTAKVAFTARQDTGNSVGIGLGSVEIVDTGAGGTLLGNVTSAVGTNQANINLNSTSGSGNNAIEVSIEYVSSLDTVPTIVF